MSEAKCCGTCKFAEVIGEDVSPPWDKSLNCAAPAPDAILGTRRLMFEDYGKYCPCWQAKQDDSK